MPKIKYYCSICDSEYLDHFDALRCEEKCVEKELRKTEGKCEYEIEQRIGVYPPMNYFWVKEDPTDKRFGKWQEEKRKYGFSEQELWCLYYTIVAFVYPRLVRFAECPQGNPCGITQDKWQEILQKIIKGFELILIDRNNDHCNKEVDEALSLFVEYFFHLWI